MTHDEIESLLFAVPKKGGHIIAIDRDVFAKGVVVAKDVVYHPSVGLSSKFEHLVAGTTNLYHQLTQCARVMSSIREMIDEGHVANEDVAASYGELIDTVLTGILYAQQTAQFGNVAMSTIKD